jgi:hypothetical protein
MMAERAGRAELRIAFCAVGEVEDDREPKTSEIAEPRIGSMDKQRIVSEISSS